MLLWQLMQEAIEIERWHQLRFTTSDWGQWRRNTF